MQFHLFQYPLPYEGSLDDLNGFLARHRVVSVKRDMVNNNGNALLVFTVETTAGVDLPESTKSKSRVDYRDELSDTDYALFNLLRDERKIRSDADGVPVFGVFNNAQLAAMVTQKATTLADIAALKGVGEARSKKYGPAMLNILLKPT